MCFLLSQRRTCSLLGIHQGPETSEQTCSIWQSNIDPTVTSGHMEKSEMEKLEARNGAGTQYSKHYNN